MNNSFGRYLPGKGFIYNFDPRAKNCSSNFISCFNFLCSSFYWHGSYYNSYNFCLHFYLQKSNSAA